MKLEFDGDGSTEATEFRGVLRPNYNDNIFLGWLRDTGKKVSVLNRLQDMMV